MVEIKNTGGISFIDKCGVIICEKCGTAHLGLKCPECENKENLGVH